MSQSCCMLQTAAGAWFVWDQQAVTTAAGAWFVWARQALTIPVAACKELVSCALQPQVSAADVCIC